MFKPPTPPTPESRGRRAPVAAHRGRRRVLPAAALLLAAVLLALPAAASPPRTGDAQRSGPGPWASIETALGRLWAPLQRWLGADQPRHRGPRSSAAPSEGDVGPEWDPDGLQTPPAAPGTHLSDRAGASETDVGPTWDPNGLQTPPGATGTLLSHRAGASETDVGPTWDPDGLQTPPVVPPPATGRGGSRQSNVGPEWDPNGRR